MVLDWKFETIEGVCHTKAVIMPLLPIRVTFSKGVASTFVMKKKLRNGFQLIYFIAEKKLCINVIDNKKQKFISLYYNGQLIREYTYNYQKYYNVYMRHNDVYGNPLNFVKYSLPYCACFAGYLAASLLILLGNIFGVFTTLQQIALTVFMALVFGFIFFEGISLLVLWFLSSRMRFYGIIDKAVKKKKKFRFHRIKPAKKAIIKV